MQTNSYDPTMAEGVELLPYPTADQQRWIEEACGTKKKDTGDVSINPKMGGACKKCGGILVDNICQSCDATQKQETQESYTIDKKAHRGAQKAAKIRNLAKGATNAGEKAAAEKKTKGPKLFGERALTQDEKDEKEKNVKGMKKSFSDFKKRYGDDAKSVMYATATKMAKEDTEISEGKKKGLWDNIHAKRKRGEKPAKPGDKDYPETLKVEERNPEVEAKGKKVGEYERAGKYQGITSKFRKEHPGSRQAKKVPGAKETEGQAANRRRSTQAQRAAKHGLTSKQKKETQARSRYYSSRD